jgi:hypothetical protein
VSEKELEDSDNGSEVLFQAVWIAVRVTIGMLSAADTEAFMVGLSFSNAARRNGDRSRVPKVRE